MTPDRRVKLVMFAVVSFMLGFGLIAALRPWDVLYFAERLGLCEFVDWDRLIPVMLICYAGWLTAGCGIFAGFVLLLLCVSDRITPPLTPSPPPVDDAIRRI